MASSHVGGLSVLALLVLSFGNLGLAADNHSSVSVTTTTRSGNFLGTRLPANVEGQDTAFEHESSQDAPFQNESLQSSWAGPAPNTCHAVDHKLCAFPFKYNGHSHGQCTTEHYSWIGGWWHGSRRWGATAVNSNFEMTSWNYCEHSCHHLSCATTGGHQCHFPFKLSSDGPEFTSCATFKDWSGETNWCPLITKIDGTAYARGNSDSGYFPDGCPDVVPLWFRVLSWFKKLKVNCQQLTGPRNNWGECEKTCR